MQDDRASRSSGDAQVLTRLAVRLENEGLVTDAELPFRQVLAIYQRVLLASDIRIAIASYDLRVAFTARRKKTKPSVFAGPRWSSVSGIWAR